MTLKNSPAARNRFVYYPDHLVKIPTPKKSIESIWNLFQELRSEPLFDKLLSSMLLEPTKPPRPHSEWQRDESIASFISRRFHPKVADNLVSALAHGVYAGDIDQLSAQTILGPFRNMDDVGLLRGTIDKLVQKKVALAHG